jgi:hypothetical protein
MTPPRPADVFPKTVRRWAAAGRLAVIVVLPRHDDS